MTLTLDSYSTLFDATSSLLIVSSLEPKLCVIVYSYVELTLLLSSHLNLAIQFKYATCCQILDPM